MILMAALDALNITMSRELLLGILAGETNKKKARRLHTVQSTSSKIRLNYIKPYATKYKKPFQTYYSIYLCTLFTLIPRYITALLFHFIGKDFLNYYLICIIAIGLIVFFSIRIQFHSDHTTKYSHR